MSPASPSGDRRVFGWRLRSALSLPEMLPWDGDDREPDVTVAVADFPEGLDDPVHRGPFLAVGRDGTCDLTVPAVARFRIRAGRSVTIAPLGPADAPDIKAFLLGTVLAMLCHQRGLLPLHASAVAIGGRAIAFAGPSGSGKSTLAATLAARGHRLLADDVVAIDPQAPGGPLLLPGLPRLKLWRDSLDALGMDAASLPRVRARQDKFLAAAPGFDPAPLRLAAVYGIVRTRPSFPPGIVPLAGRDATALLSNNVSRAIVARLIGRQVALFDGLIRLVRGVDVWLLTRPDELPALDSLARRIEDHAAAVPEPA